DAPLHSRIVAHRPPGCSFPPCTNKATSHRTKPNESSCHPETHNDRLIDLDGRGRSLRQTVKLRDGGGWIVLGSCRPDSPAAHPARIIHFFASPAWVRPNQGPKPKSRPPIPP